MKRTNALKINNQSNNKPVSERASEKTNNIGKTVKKLQTAVRTRQQNAKKV